MKNLLLPLAALAALGTFAMPWAKNSPASAAPVAGPTASAPVFHCQVPCGVYGDKMRIDMLFEDLATIEKGMGQLQAMDADDSASKNQLVRWIMNKDEHAQAIQDRVAAYWLAQRIKLPKKGSDEAAMAKYHQQLELLHRMTVAAMKCKQTTDLAHVAALRTLGKEFSETYFSKEDLEHLKGHHWDGK
jgi:nickel superoxide dismutase